MDIITFLALSLSIFSAAAVIVLISSVRRQVTGANHDDELEVSAVVSEFNQRLKRLEENLIDQKVKLEILELRAQRTSNITFKTSSESRQEAVPSSPTSYGAAVLTTTPKASEDKRAGTTEHEALRLVMEGGGKTTAKDIQQKIGRTREHTARMMNSLFQEGLVERDVTVRPFAYTITQKGREFLNE